MITDCGRRRYPPGENRVLTQRACTFAKRGQSDAVSGNEESEVSTFAASRDHRIDEVVQPFIADN
ncbi:hypothetical protein DN545_33560 [Burkholderia multivorans]|nr:hypothetical protein DN545_33560 [Burkholderia multivorans]